MELIWERAGTPGAVAFAAAVQDLKADDRWHVFYDWNSAAEFVPRGWLDWLPDVGTYDEEEPRFWVSAQFRLRERQLYYNVFVGPMKDAAVREKVIVNLRGIASRAGFKATNAESAKGMWSRVTGKEVVSDWKEDEEPEADTLCATAKKQLEDLFPKFEKLAKELKTFFGIAAPPR